MQNKALKFQKFPNQPAFWAYLASDIKDQTLQFETLQVCKLVPCPCSQISWTESQPCWTDHITYDRDTWSCHESSSRKPDFPVFEEGKKTRMSSQEGNAALTDHILAILQMLRIAQEREGIVNGPNFVLIYNFPESSHNVMSKGKYYIEGIESSVIQVPQRRGEPTSDMDLLLEMRPKIFNYVFQ